MKNHSCQENIHIILKSNHRLLMDISRMMESMKYHNRECIQPKLLGLVQGNHRELL